MDRLLKNELGGTLVLFTVAMVAMMGMGALAIDLGMLRKAKAEAQRAADAAALAGASAFQLDLDVVTETDSARTRAYRMANQNYMNGVAFDSLTEVTVVVIPDSVKVRVTARRAAVPTWFARIFGINAFPVGAVAAAEASHATGTNCIKPLAVADMWDESNDDGDHLPDSGEEWLFSDPPDNYQPAHYDGDGTGTGLGSEFRDPVTRDWGYQFALRPPVGNGGDAVDDAPQPCPGPLAQGGKCFMPGWWGLWGPNPATNQLVDRMLQCDPETYFVGTVEESIPGWKNPVSQAAGDLYATDPGARWDANAVDALTQKQGTVVGSSFGTNWRASKRVWTVAVFNPKDLPLKANGQLIFNNFMSFFFEGCINKDGTGPIAGNCGPQTIMLSRFVGPAAGTASGPSPGSMVRLLRLVE